MTWLTRDWVEYELLLQWTAETSIIFNYEIETPLNEAFNQSLFSNILAYQRRPNTWTWCMRWFRFQYTSILFNVQWDFREKQFWSMNIVNYCCEEKVTTWTGMTGMQLFIHQQLIWFHLTVFTPNLFWFSKISSSFNFNFSKIPSHWHSEEHYFYR